MNKLILALFTLISLNVSALESDKSEEFILNGDNFVNLPKINGGLTKVKFSGNVVAQQGSLKIHATEAIVYSDNNGISKVVLTGNPAKMEQNIDSSYGTIFINANKIDLLVAKEMMEMTGNVSIKSKIQGEMTGEKITMNLKTKEIKGVKSNNQRVRLIIKPRTK